MSELIDSSKTSNIVHKPTAEHFFRIIEYISKIETCFEVELKDNYIIVTDKKNRFNLQIELYYVEFLNVSIYGFTFDYNDLTFRLDYKTGLIVHSN